MIRNSYSQPQDDAPYTPAYDMDIELDDEDGKLVYEIEFKSGNMEYDYEIDAVSGAILKHEAELDD